MRRLCGWELLRSPSPVPAASSRGWELLRSRSPVPVAAGSLTHLIRQLGAPYTCGGDWELLTSTCLPASCGGGWELVRSLSPVPSASGGANTQYRLRFFQYFRAPPLTQSAIKKRQCTTSRLDKKSKLFREWEFKKILCRILRIVMKRGDAPRSKVHLEKVCQVFV